MNYKLHKEGQNIVWVLGGILVLVNVSAYLYLDFRWVAHIICGLSVIFFLLVVNFFRSPRRQFRGDLTNAVVSSVDGHVVALEETYEDEYLHRDMIQLSVFMSVFNVHANWVPVEGTVTYVKHHNGRFLAAYLPKSSTENERASTVIRAANGDEILVRQIAGAVARRITTYVDPGDKVSVDQHMGFIKFGSRVDIFLPIDSEILVKLGDVTVGGVTQVARLKPRDNKQ